MMGEMTEGALGDTPAERLHRFAVEWRILMQRGRDRVIYELHPGDPRWAECRVDDIEAILAALSPEQEQEQG
ncbi:hypothetical protein IC614_03135 [Allosphingosinicella flava]|uniref:Uncharacterized protein n=1 Tax=Allosphingosinicella flava TaxID=2771430 RepID=A0A7T2GKM7_9SPHN|nr:hypothetical protein [Sphingosinicella flava]QPQ55611.1 hypothetical protein IC614_03135 [Sphingosinicella flava]